MKIDALQSYKAASPTAKCLYDPNMCRKPAQVENIFLSLDWWLFQLIVCRIVQINPTIFRSHMLLVEIIKSAVHVKINRHCHLVSTDMEQLRFEDVIVFHKDLLQHGVKLFVDDVHLSTRRLYAVLLPGLLQ